MTVGLGIIAGESGEATGRLIALVLAGGELGAGVFDVSAGEFAIAQGGKAALEASLDAAEGGLEAFQTSFIELHELGRGYETKVGLRSLRGDRLAGGGVVGGECGFIARGGGDSGADLAPDIEFPLSVESGGEVTGATSEIGSPSGGIFEKGGRESGPGAAGVKPGFLKAGEAGLEIGIAREGTIDPKSDVRGGEEAFQRGRYFRNRWLGGIEAGGKGDVRTCHL